MIHYEAGDWKEFAKRARTEKDPEKLRVLVQELMMYALWQEQRHAKNEVLSRLNRLNWRCLRTSHATWLNMAGGTIKDCQAQMRHSRASTTMDVYMQFVPESQ